MLNIQHFTKTYGEKKAVDDLSLHIAPGEIYGFIGHNGAGKTTTLKAAVGILQFDAGEITIGGHSIKTEPLACKQLLAYIPDNPDLYDFIHDPKLVIMDEPFVGLDPKAAHLLKGMMRELCDAGGAIFFSTHVLEVAEKLCDKVAIIKGGRLIRSGTMEEVKGDDSLEDVFLELEDASC